MKLAQYLVQNKEFQVSLVNYRKTGEAFINCLTVIPLCLCPGSEARFMSASGRLGHPARCDHGFCQE